MLVVIEGVGGLFFFAFAGWPGLFVHLESACSFPLSRHAPLFFFSSFLFLFLSFLPLGFTTFKA